MIAIYDINTGEIKQSVWAEELPPGMELSSDEDWMVVEAEVEPHKLHCCRMKLDKKGKPTELKEPIFEITKHKGHPLLEERRVKEWKSHKIEQKAR